MKDLLFRARRRMDINCLNRICCDEQAAGVGVGGMFGGSD